MSLSTLLMASLLMSQSLNTTATFQQLQPGRSADGVVADTGKNSTTTVMVHGQVISNEGLPLVGATVLAVGTHQCVATSEQGDFVLSVPPSEETIKLVCNYEGYQEQVQVLQVQRSKAVQFQLIKKEVVQLPVTGTTREL